MTGSQDIEEVVDVMRTDAIRVDGAEHYHADVAHRQRVARARCHQVNDVALPAATDHPPDLQPTVVEPDRRHAVGNDAGVEDRAGATNARGERCVSAGARGGGLCPG